MDSKIWYIPAKNDRLEKNVGIYCRVSTSERDTIESLMSISKSDLQEAAKALSKEDIPQLIEWLTSKDDSIRYQAFLLLQNRSLFFADVYPYWDTL